MKAQRLFPASLALGMSALVFLVSMVILPSCIYSTIPAARVVRPSKGITELGGGLRFGEAPAGIFIAGQGDTYLRYTTAPTPYFGGNGWAYQGFTLGSNFEIGGELFTYGRIDAPQVSGAGLLIKWDPMPDEWPLHLIPFTCLGNIGSALVFTPAEWIELFGSAAVGYPSEASLGLRLSLAPWLQLSLVGSAYPEFGSSQPAYAYYDVSLAANLLWPTTAAGAARK